MLLFLPGSHALPKLFNLPVKLVNLPVKLVNLSVKLVDLSVKLVNLPEHHAADISKMVQC